MAGGGRLAPFSTSSANTPLVELKRLSPKPSVRLYAKLEGQNPSGSLKDRIAKAMVETAEARGELQPGRELLEPTSGNTGISLAMVARLKGYGLTCVMPANATPERRRLLELMGAVDRGIAGGRGHERLGSAGAAAGRGGSALLHAVPVRERGERAGPLRGHRRRRSSSELDRVDVLVAGLGTGGTLMGAGARVRESFPDAVIAAAEPLPGDPVIGLRSLEDGYVPPILDVSRLDRKLLVTNAESVAGVRVLLEREAIFAGVSSGAVVHVARLLAEELDEGVVVCVLADGGWKYLSASFWGAEDVESAMENSIWW